MREPGRSQQCRWFEVEGQGVQGSKAQATAKGGAQWSRQAEQRTVRRRGWGVEITKMSLSWGTGGITSQVFGNRAFPR
jgi:hypothetical protein